DLDCADLRILNHGKKPDINRARSHRNRVSLVDGDVDTPGGRKRIEVVFDQNTIDDDFEHPLADAREINFGEFQDDRIIAVGYRRGEFECAVAEMLGSVKSRVAGLRNG